MKAAPTFVTAPSPRLSDAILQTGVPGALVYRRAGMLPAVFDDHPRVVGSALWAWTARLRFGAREARQAPGKPELRVSAPLREWVRREIAEHTPPERRHLPLFVLHPWPSVPDRFGRVSETRFAPAEFWDDFVSRFRTRANFWEVGMIGHGAVQGCLYYSFSRGSAREARELFALLDAADGFVGAQSAPLLAYRALGKNRAMAVLTAREADETAAQVRVDPTDFTRLEPHGSRALTERLDRTFETLLKESEDRHGHRIQA